MHHQKSFCAVAIIVWILTALTGCATVNPPAAQPSAVVQSWETRKTALSHLQNWQINGKIAVTTAQDSGSANVDWSQHAENFTMSLYGPLGANNVTLNGGPGGVTMHASNGKKVSAQSAEQLLAQEWGWKLPVSHLKYWVRGLPVPGVAQNTRFDSSNRLLALSQQGYTIQFMNYTTKGSLELPQLITINSPSFKSKIVIHQWHVG